ncbi:SO2930 family diheme c-type cytochrome, partial [Qipengyuania sp. CAU 1752]
MRHGLALLCAAGLALAGSIAARAVPSEQSGQVNFAAVLDDAMPRTLSEYGFFVGETRLHRTAVRVIPYRLNTPLYSDGAEKLRFLAFPPGARLTVDGEGLLQFPIGTALIKTFAYGEGAQRRLIETRVLLHRAEGWLALPYKWNEAQTEARLAVAGVRLP